MLPATLRLLVASVLLLLIPAGLSAAPADWAAEIDALTRGDAVNPPAPDGVVFVGSSSIRLWSTLREDFPGIPVINRGFGGSQLPDSVHYLDRIVIPYRPRTVVLYSGENDLAAGKTPADVLASFEAFRRGLHAALPQTRLIFLSIKESPSRERFRAAMREANRLVAAVCATDPRLLFVDVNTPLHDAAGNPRPELFIGDQLHLAPAGYAIWRQALAPKLVRE